MWKKSSRRCDEMGESDAKKLLVIEDDETQRNSIRELIGNETAHPDRRGRRAGKALEALRKERFDCVVLDLMLPDMSGFELIDKIRTQATAPADHRLYRPRTFRRRRKRNSIASRRRRS